MIKGRALPGWQGRQDITVSTRHGPRTARAATPTCHHDLWIHRVVHPDQDSGGKFTARQNHWVLTSRPHGHKVAIAKLKNDLFELAYLMSQVPSYDWYGVVKMWKHEHKIQDPSWM